MPTKLNCKVYDKEWVSVITLPNPSLIINVYEFVKLDTDKIALNDVTYSLQKMESLKFNPATLEFEKLEDNLHLIEKTYSVSANEKFLPYGCHTSLEALLVSSLKNINEDIDDNQHLDQIVTKLQQKKNIVVSAFNSLNVFGEEKNPNLSVAV